MKAIPVEVPCGSAWQEMRPVGKQVRHCASCQHDVYDFSAMTEARVQVLVMLHVGSSRRLCARQVVTANGDLVVSAPPRAGRRRVCVGRSRAVRCGSRCRRAHARPRRRCPRRVPTGVAPEARRQRRFRSRRSWKTAMRTVFPTTSTGARTEAGVVATQGCTAVGAGPYSATLHPIPASASTSNIAATRSANAICRSSMRS